MISDQTESLIFESRQVSLVGSREKGEVIQVSRTLFQPIKNLYFYVSQSYTRLLVVYFLGFDQWTTNNTAVCSIETNHRVVNDPTNGWSVFSKVSNKIQWKMIIFRFFTKSQWEVVILRFSPRTQNQNFGGVLFRQLIGGLL